jgi:hypothetical protein
MLLAAQTDRKNPMAWPPGPTNDGAAFWPRIAALPRYRYISG